MLLRVVHIFTNVFKKKKEKKGKKLDTLERWL